MKVYISADIEGVSGIVNWDETEKSKSDYSAYCIEMTREVRAACEGANNAGVEEIWIKDAHDTGRNLNLAELPSNARLIRSFSGHPFCMMQELDSSFDAVIMTGYHSFAGSDENPLSHTMTTTLSYMKINGEYASEFVINSYIASYVGVPVIFVSGDSGLCEQVKKFNENINTVSTKKGIGSSVISIHPDKIYSGIVKGVEDSLKGDFRRCFIKLPEKFEVELSFVNHTKAYKASFYPGAKKISPTSILYCTDDYFEVLRMMNFVL